MKHQSQPMIALKYIDKDKRWSDKKSNIDKYRSFFSDVMDKLNEALPLSKDAKEFYIQGLAIIETKAYFRIKNRRCWVSTNKGHTKEMYDDTNQSI